MIPQSRVSPVSPPYALIVAVAGWTTVGAIMTIAINIDASRRGANVALLENMAGNLAFFIPLMGLSWGLHRFFTAYADDAFNPRAIFRLYLAVALLFYPLFIFYENAVGLVLASQDLSGVWPSMLQQSRFSWWTDFMIVTGAFALHVAVAAWRRSKERERALAIERADNLQLRLSLLQGQLEPHFLFNALSGISALVRSGERADALTALSQVSDLLRYALRASQNQWLSVRDEIDFIDDYLNVQVLRFGDNLRVTKNYDDAPWESLSCAPLLFQPLIENAVRHGLEARPEGGAIEVSLTRTDGMVRFEVRNDVGESASGHGVGLATTRARLLALYSVKASLDAGLQEGRFCAAVSFPAVADR